MLERFPFGLHQYLHRHARPKPFEERRRFARLWCRASTYLVPKSKTWMAGTSPAMTTFDSALVENALVELAAVRDTTIDLCDCAFDALQIVHFAGFLDTHAHLEGMGAFLPQCRVILL